MIRGSCTRETKGRVQALALWWRLRDGLSVLKRRLADRHSVIALSLNTGLNCSRTQEKFWQALSTRSERGEVALGGLFIGDLVGVKVFDTFVSNLRTVSCHRQSFSGRRSSSSKSSRGVKAIQYGSRRLVLTGTSCWRGVHALSLKNGSLRHPGVRCWSKWRKMQWREDRKTEAGVGRRRRAKFQEGMSPEQGDPDDAHARCISPVDLFGIVANAP
jgi:hypothetical protein